MRFGPRAVVLLDPLADREEHPAAVGGDLRASDGPHAIVIVDPDGAALLRRGAVEIRETNHRSRDEYADAEYSGVFPVCHPAFPIQAASFSAAW